MSLDDFTRRVNLADMEPHVLTIDPEADIMVRSDQYGTYWVIIVQENGRDAELKMRYLLRERLADLKLKRESKLRITREGSGFDTDYRVEDSW